MTFPLLDALPRRFRTLMPLIDNAITRLTSNGFAALCLAAYRPVAPVKDRVAFWLR
ncbi:hypothetical protein SODG_005171 [Sodalis praecaptivus]